MAKTLRNKEKLFFQSFLGEESAGELEEIEVKKSKLKSIKNYKLSFGGVITKTSRELLEEEIEKHRNIFCKHLDFCLEFACIKLMKGFSCANCSFFGEK